MTENDICIPTAVMWKKAKMKLKEILSCFVQIRCKMSNKSLGDIKKIFYSNAFQMLSVFVLNFYVILFLWKRSFFVETETKNNKKKILL